MPKNDFGTSPPEPATITHGLTLWGAMKDEITIPPDVDLTQPFFTDAWEPYLGDNAPTNPPER